MGQKIHPKFFRLGISQNYVSNWYSVKSKYKYHLEEDYILRTKIENTLKNILITSNINIYRITNPLKEANCIYITIPAQLTSRNLLIKEIRKLFNIEIKFLRSKVKMKLISLLIQYKLRELLRVFQYKYKQDFYISIRIVKSYFEDAFLLAKNIGYKLKKRIPFRRVLKETFRRSNSLNVLKGLKIQISGRLNGQDMARTEWKREGTIPLHTLNIKIDYSSHYIETIYGLMGIKVWLYK